MRRVSGRTFLLAFSFLLTACHPEAEQRPTSPPVIEAPIALDSGSAPLPEAEPASTAVDAAPAPEAPPKVTAPDMSAAPAYPPSALYEAFSASATRKKLIGCYLPGKARDPKLRGKVIVKFTIHSDGTAKEVTSEGSNLQADDVIACVVRTVKTIRFTKPVEGTVTVVYPLIFRPTGDETLILPDAGKKP
jgi:outer membrane biosynthesis protein TonB